MEMIDNAWMATASDLTYMLHLSALTALLGSSPERGGVDPAKDDPSFAEALVLQYRRVVAVVAWHYELWPNIPDLATHA